MTLIEAVALSSIALTSIALYFMHLNYERVQKDLKDISAQLTMILSNQFRMKDKDNY